MIPDWETERHRMVETQLQKRGISDPRVLAAMLEIPREEFVPIESRVLAYRDEPAPIGAGQTISQPYMTALMAELLELTGTETVLEIGAGCGYATAVLGKLAARVIALEIVPGLARLARRNLVASRRDWNILIVEGDGSMGHAGLGPYEGISVAAGAPELPGLLVEQLTDGGRLVIPVGNRQEQDLRLVRKIGSQIVSRAVIQCRFVLLRGGGGWR